MKTKNILLIILIFSSFLNFGQVNLIPNGDFELGPLNSSAGWENEINNNCEVIGSMQGPLNWERITGSPDRLILGDIPCNWDDDIPFSGNAYIVLGYQESGKATLIETLNSDKSYKVKYYAKMETFRNISNDSISFLLIIGNDTVKSPIIFHNSEWSYYEYDYYPTSNFNTLTLKVVDFVSTGVKIDKIELEVIDSLNSFENIVTNPYLIYPNPSNGEVNLKYFSNPIIDLYNHLGIVKKNIKLSKNYLDTYSFNTNDLAEGYYYLKITDGLNIILFKISIIK